MARRVLTGIFLLLGLFFLAMGLQHGWLTAEPGVDVEWHRRWALILEALFVLCLLAALFLFRRRGPV